MEIDIHQLDNFDHAEDHSSHIWPMDFCGIAFTRNLELPLK